MLNKTVSVQTVGENEKILFIFDRVAHYHRELFKTLEISLYEMGMELHLLSGQGDDGLNGRVGLGEKVISNEYKYRFKEYRIGTHTFRRSVGVVKKLHQLKPNVVVCMGHVGNITHWRLTQLKKKLGFKLIAWQCGYEYNPGRTKALVLRRFVPRFDHHLAYHTNARQYALTYGARPDQITVMHNTINEERIMLMPKEEARRSLIEKHPEIDSRRILLFVGAVLVEKRIEVILDAMNRLDRKDIVLLLVGDGDHLPAIRVMCADRQDVVLTGSIVAGVGPYFDAAEMYLLPGTGGLGINEAMAHGLPIVSGFADGSADDLVVDGKNGFRLRDCTTEELADHIAFILDHPEDSKRMGKTSQEWITGKFAFKKFIDRIKTTLLEVA